LVEDVLEEAEEVVEAAPVVRAAVGRLLAERRG
jgi:hypothetical protein